MRQKKDCMVYYLKLSKDIHVDNLHKFQQKCAMDMLKKGFLEIFDLVLDEAKIKRDSLGKPFYEGENCFFNISHCPDAVVVAVSKFPVGIDVESMRNIKFGTAKKCCTTEELQYVLQENGEEDDKGLFLTVEQTKRFLRLWTLKESYVKMTGKGLRMPVNTIDFDMERMQKKGDNRCMSYLHFPQNLILALTIKNSSFFSDFKVLWQEYNL